MGGNARPYEFYRTNPQFHHQKNKGRISPALLSLFQHPAAEDDVAVVEHRGLPRRDGALRLVKEDVRAAVRPGCDRGRLLRLAVAHLRAAADGAARRLPRDPVHIRRRRVPAEQRLRRPEDDRVVRRTNFTHVGPLVLPEAEAPVLPDRVVDDALVLPEDVAVRVDKVARLRLFAGVALDGGGIVAVRREADVLAVGLSALTSPPSSASFRASGFE